MAPTDQQGLEILNEDDCFDLLGTQWLGRLAVTVGALPAILPIVYAVDGNSIVFRTVAGTKLDAIGRGQVVCFEADSADRATGQGWSVMVVGKGVEAADPVEFERLARLLPDRWPVARADRFVRLPGHVVTGRRVAPSAISSMR